MRPTSRQLIESIVAAIDQVILPAVTEKQAASSLRAARTLLEHLAVRSDRDTQQLAEDTHDAETVLRQLAGEPALPLTPIASEDMMALQTRNDSLQAVIELTLRAMPPAGREGAADAEVRKALRAYLARRRARERDMIFPAFLGTPF